MSETEPIRLVLPYPPSNNNLTRTFHIGAKAFRGKTSQATNYRKAVQQIALLDRITPFTGAIAIAFQVYRPRRVGDLDNLFKAPLDALKGFAFVDDKQIVRLTAERFDDKAHPRVEVEIFPLPDSVPPATAPKRGRARANAKGTA